MPTITRLADGVIERRFAEIGRIRLGDKSEKGAPRKLTKFRITSSNRGWLEAVAAVYGGTVTAWDDAPTGRGTQHQLYVESETLDVMVPPGQVLTQSYELWSGGGCQRRCNGIALETGEACKCPADPDERATAAQKGQACKLTTRLSVWLPRVAGIAVARLESHGWYAGMELPGVADLLAAASEAGRPIPATLRIASRVVKRDGQTKQFIVPQLDPAVPVGTMMAIARGDEVAVPELAAPKAPALTTGQPAAIEAPKPPSAPVQLSDGARLVERITSLDAELKAEFLAWRKTQGIPSPNAKHFDENEAHRAAVAQWLDVMTRPEPGGQDDDPGREF